MVDEGDRLLPIANVGRIMKQILPPTAKISKGAKETMQECVTEFISFVTGEASDKCHKENRKTVNGDDICWALSTLGFDNFGEAITQYLHKYREFEREKACQGKAEEGLMCGGISSSSTEDHRYHEDATKFTRDRSDDQDQHQQQQLLDQTNTSAFPLEFRIIDPKG
ncbi:nuclear transcription factor Y subunit B-4 [Beta vulgaris subsp. vulgaris]|uniref:nuclear transcription factor Y subunit B-4 n=1 Tax=Beta vulgaris subsp. vulgaris TaxID=3555 RepID=UPI0020366815|nr:nuclear transcription factor Y subunit B-4 [Beta vulgaris subsp. vulgaris]